MGDFWEKTGIYVEKVEKVEKV